MKNVDIIELDVKEDERGWLVEVLRREHLPDDSFGQFYVTTAKPGVAKGGHYHRHKREWFCVIKGGAEILLTNVETGEEKNLQMGEDNIITVGVKPGIAHLLKNTGNEMMYVLIYSDTPFDPDNPDTLSWEFE